METNNVPEEQQEGQQLTEEQIDIIVMELNKKIMDGIAQADPASVIAEVKAIMEELRASTENLPEPIKENKESKSALPSSILLRRSSSAPPGAVMPKIQKKTSSSSLQDNLIKFCEKTCDIDLGINIEK